MRQKSHHELDPPPELPPLEPDELDELEEEECDDDENELLLDEPQELLFPDDRWEAMYEPNPSPLPFDRYTR
jgi:hypothetical protein